MSELTLTLTSAEKISSTWNTIRNHYTARLETLRSKLEGSVDEKESDRYRGRIAEIRALLAADKDEVVDEEFSALGHAEWPEADQLR